MESITDEMKRALPGPNRHEHLNTETAADAARKKAARPKYGSWAPAFLKALADTGVVRAACEAAEVDRATVYKYRDHNEGFRKQWDEALEASTDALEAVARMRATTISDTLLIFLLKANRPDKYRETRNVEISGPQGGPIRQQLVEIDDEERASRLAALLDKAGERRARQLIAHDGGVGEEPDPTVIDGDS